MVQADPNQLRYTGNRFSAGSQEFLYRARQLKDLTDALLQGSHKWSGIAADAFQAKSERMHHDLSLANQAFERVAIVMQTLAYKMEQVNQLRAEAQQIERSLWGFIPLTADDQAHVIQMQQRVQQLTYTADMEAAAADAQAASAFQEIAELEKSLFVKEVPITPTPQKKETSFWDRIVQDVEGIAEGAATLVKEVVIDIPLNFDEGVLEAAGDTLKGLANLVIHPIDTFRGIGMVIEHPIMTLEAIGSSIKGSWEKDIVHGTADTRAKWVGYASAEVVLAIFGPKGVDKVAKVLQEGATLGEAGKAAVDLTKAGKKAVDLSSASKTAEDLAKTAGENGNLEGDFYQSADDSRYQTGLLSTGAIKMSGAPFDQEVDSILARYGMTKEEFNVLKNKQLVAPGTLTEQEQQVLMDIRNSVTLTPETVMQKVIPMKDVSKYLSGQYTQVGGFVARAQDVVDLKDPLEIMNELRLDYNSPKHPYPEYFDQNRPNPYLDAEGNFLNDPVALVRFNSAVVGKYSVPYEFEDVDSLMKSYPYSGSGFLGGQNVIPEYYLSKMDIPNGTEIYIKNIDGSETLIARNLGYNVWEKY